MVNVTKKGHNYSKNTQNVTNLPGNAVSTMSHTRPPPDSHCLSLPHCQPHQQLAFASLVQTAGSGQAKRGHADWKNSQPRSRCASSRKCFRSAHGCGFRPSWYTNSCTGSCKTHACPGSDSLYLQSQTGI